MDFWHLCSFHTAEDFLNICRGQHVPRWWLWRCQPWVIVTFKLFWMFMEQITFKSKTRSFQCVGLWLWRFILTSIIHIHIIPKVEVFALHRGHLGSRGTTGTSLCSGLGKVGVFFTLWIARGIVTLILPASHEMKAALAGRLSPPKKIKLPVITSQPLNALFRWNSSRFMPCKNKSLWA